MRKILPEIVIDLAKINKILVIRTDRIGDVLLSTPVLENLRKNFPKAHIAVMVRACTADIVQGNPHVNEVIIYEPKEKHQSWLSSLKFAFSLRKKKFDLALIVHPTCRSHIVSFLAGIKNRIGYDRKFAFLLTKKIPHLKQAGQMHERDYALQLLQALGIKPQRTNPYMPLAKESESWAEQLLTDHGIELTQDKLIAIHADASCPSKKWPLENFAQVAKYLIKERGAKIAIIGAKESVHAAAELKQLIGAGRLLDLSGKTTISQLASFLKRCSLFISNDSGPVHIASSVGTPVISIFGRNQPGLSPKRWGPLGEAAKSVHKDAGCPVCLAHNCEKGFLCLKSITAQEIIDLACQLL